MKRQELAMFLAETYSCVGEHLFARYPNFQVFRHYGNKKWFAVLMDIPRKNLGLTGDSEISVANLKCETRLIGSFREEPGIFPGWHMNKAYYIGFNHHKFSGHTLETHLLHRGVISVSEIGYI